MLKSIIRKITLPHFISLYPGKTRIVPIHWKTIPKDGRIYILNATHYNMAHTLMDNSTLYYVQITNPSNKVLTIRKRSRLGTITKVYKLNIITVIMPAVLTALAVAVAVKPILTPAPTQKHAGTLSINLLVSINQVPAALTDYFIT